MAGASLTPSADRATVVDFSIVYTEDGAGILLQKPRGEKDSVYIKIFKPLHYLCVYFLLFISKIFYFFLSILNTSIKCICCTTSCVFRVWLLVLGSLIIVGIISFVINSIASCVILDEPDKQNWPETDLKDNIWHMYSIFTEQSL